MSISSAPSRRRTSSAPDAGHLPRRQAALPRHEAEIERADPRRRAVQHAEAVPAVLDRAEARSPPSRRASSNGRAVGARERAGADDHHRTLGLAQHFGEACAGRSCGQRFRCRRRDNRKLSQVGLRRRSRRSETFAARQRLADARIEHRRLPARIGADQQQRVGRLDARRWWR